IIIYLNNIAVIQSLRRTPTPLSQAVFLDFYLVDIKWVPRYIGIINNKTINKLVKIRAEGRELANKIVILVYLKRLVRGETREDFRM
ncbi:hypothetical protein QR685DRAFT_436684, partial [Neurospora intermedia]